MSMYDSSHKATNKILVLVCLSLAISVGMFVDYIVEEPKEPTVEFQIWGNRPNDAQIREFTINVSDNILEDLKYRLIKRRPITETLENTGNAFGLQSKTLEDILNHWTNNYDWRKREQILNEYIQYQTTILGLNIHFLHIKSRGVKTSYPLLLLHGWPVTFQGFYSVIPKLLEGNGDFNFDLIIPSLPGNGFSDPSLKPGLKSKEVATIFKILMDRLNYDQFYIFGQDLGSLIGTDLSILYPKNVLGFYNTMCISFRKISLIKYGIETLIPDYIIRDKSKYPVVKSLKTLWNEAGYLHYQTTKPDAIGVGLNDSPAGLTAYLLNILMIGGDLDNYMKSGLRKYNYDDLIDIVMLFWINGSATSSFRLYVDFLKQTLYQHPLSKAVPVSCPKLLKGTFYQPSWIYVDKFTNVVQSTVFNNGGHFSLLEDDQENKAKIIDDIFNSIIKMRKFKN